jgi:phage terminase large subunit
LGYVPTPKQKRFHEMSAARVDAILFGGARGGGKSRALTMDAIDFAVNYPGIRILCLRRTVPELAESFLAELKKCDYAAALGCKWRETDNKLRFPNGSEIRFSYAETEVDISRILGGEYQVIYIDECTRTLSVIIKHSEENLRSGNPAVPVIGWRGASNPGGVGGTYCKNRFIKPTGRGDHLAVDESGRSVGYIQALYTDNPYINQAEYKKILDGIEDPARRAAMRDGDWDAQVGQFFEQWSYDRHVIPLHWQLPKEWQRYAGIDYGKAAPWAVCWSALDPASGRMWIYRELYAIGVDAKSQAMQILEAEEGAEEGDDVIRSADPSMWGDRGTPMSIADIYGYNGCGIMQANNNRPSGWARCHHFLSEAPACEYHEELGRKEEAEGKPNTWETCPLLHVFGDECPNFVETIPELPRKASDPDDAETKNVPDHMPDAWRYMCMTAGTAGGPVIYENESSASPEDIRQLHEEETAAYLPAQSPLYGGRFAGGEFRMNG